MIEGDTPYEALHWLISQAPAPNPMDAVFALCTVAADMRGWREPGLQQLSDRCFDDATLFLCELWSKGYRLTSPSDGVDPAPHAAK